MAESLESPTEEQAALLCIAVREKLTSMRGCKNGGVLGQTRPYNQVMLCLTRGPDVGGVDMCTGVCPGGPVCVLGIPRTSCPGWPPGQRGLN